MQKESFATEAIDAEDLYAIDDEPELVAEMDEDFDDDDESYEISAEGVEDFDDDGDIEFSEYDGDDPDDEFIGPLIAGLGAPLIGKGIRGLGRMLSKGSRRQRRFRGYSRIPVGRGVRGARVRTPRGVATLRLPSSVVSMSEYKRGIATLQARDNSLTRRINKTQSDLAKTEKKATRAYNLSTQASTRLVATQRAHRRDIARTNKEIAKIKKNQSSQATMNMLFNMMQMQGIQSNVKQHLHGGTAGATSNISEQNSMLMMLPLMMSDSSGNDNDALMMMMLMQSMGKS